jgi:hypothetical protein
VSSLIFYYYNFFLCSQHCFPVYLSVSTYLESLSWSPCLSFKFHIFCVFQSVYVHVLTVKYISSVHSYFYVCCPYL